MEKVVDKMSLEDKTKKPVQDKDDLDALYKKYPVGSVIRNHEEAANFLTVQERQKYDGGVFPRECEGLHFNYHDFVNVSAKEAQFRNCDFKYATLVGVYFKGAKFKNCDFTGARFRDCNFKDCTFNGCNFKYTEFTGTHIPNNELLLNMPAWLNVRRDLMKTLRKNAESVGDTNGTKLFIREEIKAARLYSQEAWRHSTDYYRQKYPNFSIRCKLFFRAGGFFLDDFFWGHGEYPLNLARFIVIVLAISALIVLLSTPSIGSVKLLEVVNLYFNAFLASIYNFLGVTPKVELPVLPEWLKLVLALFRYVAIGFFTTSLFRFLSRR